jgi:hypothetical protein
MEHPDQTLVTVTIENKEINITYSNGEIECLPVNRETYIKMHDEWLVDQPPFISDLYKIQMRNIILATINNNERCIEELDFYFRDNNNDEIKKFLVYMRNRDLSQEKQKWKPL